MRVLVTGGAGFLGSHLVEALLASGHDVLVVDNLVSGLRQNVANNARFLQLDIRSDLTSVFQAFEPEVVVHLAAQVSVPRSVQYPLEDLSINLGGTVNVMETAARWNARKVVAVSSAAVYGVPVRLPVSEDSPTVALSPYGLSKLAGEQYIRLLGALRRVPYTILRPANIYGPRQTAVGDGAVIPTFLRAFLDGADPILQGGGSQTRDFIYVADMVRAIIASLNAGDGMTLNVSSGTQVSIQSLWTMLAKLLGWSRPPVVGPSRVGDIPASVLSNDAVRESLGWQPGVSIEEGLRYTVQWAVSQQVAATRTGDL